MYNILCAGCSFTAGWNHTSDITVDGTDDSTAPGPSFIPADYANGHPASALADEITLKLNEFILNPYVSYTNYLPETTYNIGRPASGIQSQDISNFIMRNKNIRLTHFIYQVPSPARQPKQLSDPYAWPFCGKHKDNLWSVGKKNRTLWRLLKGGNVEEFNNRHLFLNKALSKVNNNVNIVKREHPDVKIIFLRYEEGRNPLIAEFCKDFYKQLLPNYCEDNDITYIYEKQFNTLWFYRHNLTVDKVHPNIEGSKLIANRIKKNL